MNTFNRPGEYEIPAERYGVKADGVTDDAQAVQSLIDAVEADPSGPKQIRLPRGRIVLGSPLVMGAAQFTSLVGDPCGQTVLVSRYGSGHALCVFPGVFGLTLHDSLVPGPGHALRLGVGHKGVDLSAEPELDLNGLAELTVSYFFRRAASAPEAGVHFHCGGEVGAAVFHGIGVWDYFGGLAVYWGTPNPIYAAGVAQEVGVTYHVTLRFAAGVVKLLVGEPGCTPVEVLSALVGPLTPIVGNGLERFCLGYNGYGPDGEAERSHRSGEVWVDGLHVSEVARDAAVCPTVKPAADPASRFVCNFERRRIFLYGSTGKRGSGADGVYTVPPVAVEIQGGGHQLRGLTFESHSGASGPLIYGAIGCRMDDIGTIWSRQGITFRGSTYGGRFRDIRIIASAHGWVQTSQSMETVTSNLSIRGTGILYYLAGSCGGITDFLTLTPDHGTWCSMVIRGANEALFSSTQLDDEGQVGPNVGPQIRVTDGTLTIDHGQLVRNSPGVLVECDKGGAFDSRAWLHTWDGPDPIVRFLDQPHTKPDVRPCRRATTAPLTDHPEWLQFPPTPEVHDG